MNLLPQDFPNSRLLYLIFLSCVLLTASSCSSGKKLQQKNVKTVIETARSFRGTPYRYGGTTRAGMDCSALVFQSFQSVNINLPRNSEAQSKVGKKISEQQLQPGDILFFATGKKKNQVSHSGIVTDTSRGNILFIHSSTSLGVTEDNLSQAYWKKAFLFGKRVW